jgi:hypothetical protein
MLRKAYSVRFPIALANALDTLSARTGHSRSDLIENLLGDVDQDDREAIVKTPVPGASTEKRNLRLSPGALQQLEQLAGDLEPSDFLRRTVAYVVQMVPPEEHQQLGPSGDGRPVSPRMRRPHGRRGAVEEVAHNVTHGAAPIGLIVTPVLLALGVLIAFIVWVVYRLSSPPPPRLADDRRGHLPPGPAGSPEA